MVGWFKSFLTPLTVMVAIPFSLIGILPAHAALGAFFTATSMIGFMAGAGIVVRNSIILVDLFVKFFHFLFCVFVCLLLTFCDFIVHLN